MNRFPWWGSVLLAILVYCALKYGMVRFLAVDHRLIGLCQLLAPLAAMALLLLAGKQLYDNDNAAPENQETEPDNTEKQAKD